MQFRRGPVLLLCLSLVACASRQVPAPAVSVGPARAPAATAYEADLTGL
jgi:hypothetical protein